MWEPLPSFKAYDVRGRVPDDLDEDIAYWTAKALVLLAEPRRVVIGRDMRLSGPNLQEAFCKGLREQGVDVVDLGLVGTEQVYHATFHLDAGAGVMITASHNPADYNGMKFVREQGIPISGDTGLVDMGAWVAQAVAGSGPLRDMTASTQYGDYAFMDLSTAYIEHLLGYVELNELRPLRIVANGGDGMAGPVLELLRGHLPLEFLPMHWRPDGSFPRGVPNPLLPENRAATSQAVLAAGADLGIAWDGDFDRCFFFDEKGAFVEGYYLVGLLAQEALRGRKGGRIIHDPRLIWNTVEMVRDAGGIPIMNKSGHAFIKERMRREDALYGGEMSAHHYFRDFSYCDSGMIPWLLVTLLMSRSGQTLSEMVRERQERFPISGEINLELPDAAAALAGLKASLAPDALSVNEMDGVSLEFERWRVNVRSSNTEPVVRVNLETRGDRSLLEEKTEEVLYILRGEE
ncbi:MAG: phosphomannomutase [Actinobacteria bacterium]|nr:phosphomannomutase [Actinomycetota bacterium]